MPDQNQGLRTRAPWSSNNSNADRTAQSNPVSPLATSQEDFEEHECDDCPRQSGRTPGYWLILVFFVGPFYVIPPLSWANVLYTVARLQQQQIAWRDLCTWRCSVLIYSGFECIFSVYYFFLCRKVSKVESQVPERDPVELRLAVQRLLANDLPNICPPPTDSSLPRSPSSPLPPAPPHLDPNDPQAVDFRNHFRRWFRGKPWHQISRQSMREWFAWSLFDARLSSLDERRRRVVEEGVGLVEARTGCLLKDGVEGGEEDVVRPTSDPIVMWMRPGLLYAVGWTLGSLSEWWLRWKYGVRKMEFEGIEYLIREGLHDSKVLNSQPEAIILLHGLGFGLLQYLYTIVFLLNSIPLHQALAVPLDPSISQSIWHPSHLEPMSRQNWVRGLKGLIEKYGWDSEGVTMISHSKGTYVHTWMLKEHPKLVKRSCFADPVCFCIWEGDLCWNFVYREPRNPWQLVIKYFAATEPGISLAIQRHFDWVANALWVEEIPHCTEPYYACFILGGLDVVINPLRVKRYLEKHGIREGIHWNPKGHHSEAALGRTGMRDIVNWLRMPPTNE